MIQTPPLSRCELTGRWRLQLEASPTPLVEAAGLKQFAAGTRLLIKRDDRYGLIMGGNKYRQMEFMFADAIQQNADVIVATGAVQSNLVCAAAAIAKSYGMDCVIKHELRFQPASDNSYFENGNRLLLKALGAKVLDPPLVGDNEAAADSELHKICKDLLGQGRKPFPILMGNTGSKIGSLGYVRCAKEILDQCNDIDIDPDYIFLPSGSGLTHIGILAGLRLFGSKANVIGICIRRPAPDQLRRLSGIASAVEGLLNITGLITRDDIKVWDSTLGEGYGISGPRETLAIKDFAQQAGCLLDPVYSGKCVTGMRDYMEKSAPDPSSSCVFLHTGGSAALFAYPEVINEKAL